MCIGHMKHMKHMKFEKGFFERTAGENAFQRMGYELLPPSADGSPPSRREVLGGCVPARSLLYNPGCRVETLLVSMGVMGFLGDLRGEKFEISPKSPRPSGASFTPSTAHGAVPPPPRREVWGFAGQGLPALPSIGYRGFAVAPMTLRAPLRGTAVQPTVANTSDRCNDATQRCKHISQLQFPATL